MTPLMTTEKHGNLVSLLNQTLNIKLKVVKMHTIGAVGLKMALTKSLKTTPLGGSLITWRCSA